MHCQYIFVSDMVKLFHFFSLSTFLTSFTVKMEKVLEYSVFSPEQIFSNIFANSLMTEFSFSFSKLITFVVCSYKEVQNFFMQSSPRYKLCLYSTFSNAEIIRIGYLQRICFPIFVVENIFKITFTVISFKIQS